MNPESRIYVAGHRGLAGSAMVRRLEAAGFSNLVTRSHAELDLADQAAVRRFLDAERPEHVMLAAARVGGILANETYPAELALPDVPAWSVHEPAWQRRYLGAEAPEAASLRALFGNVMLDIAWSLFEMRMLRDPAADPNLVWTDITSRYLHIVPHPEVPWWAMRVQLASDPGYMVNYGLGAVLTAEMRAATVAGIGPVDAGNARWYGWTRERLLNFGSERDTRSLMFGLLGRPAQPGALLAQVRRCWPTR